MRIAVFGTGGIGGYFGGRLAHSGEDVRFVARGEHLAAIRRDGLRVESVRGGFVVHPATATDDPAEVGEVDVVLLGVKTWQLPEATLALRPMLGRDTFVVTTQNGVEAPHQVAEAVGRDRVVPGVARIFSRVGGPGRIVHAGGPASLAFAEWDDRPSERVSRFRETLERAGVSAETPRDVEAELWAKFVFVVPMGGVGAVSRAPVGVLRGMPETRRMLEAAMEEIAAVARARGVTLPDDVVARTMGFVDAQPAAGTTSLQRDVAAGHRSELEAWTGAVVRLGAEAGVDTPLHRFLHHSLLPLERRARGEVEFAD